MKNWKKPLFLSMSLLAGALAACGGNESSHPVKMRYGTLIGNSTADVISGTSQMTFIKKSAFARLVEDKENFVLLVHGSEDTCSCFTTWHDTVFAPYVKRNRLLVYAMTLKEFESDEHYYGVKRVLGYDTVAVFRDGMLAHQACTDDQAAPFVTDPAYFSNWMKARVGNPEIFYVNETILDGFYKGSSPFTVYFARETCGDCSYLNRTALRDYLDATDIVDKNFFLFDLDPYRPAKDDPDYDVRMEEYQGIKDKYGLSWDEDNPAGYDTGAVPTVYYIQPDGSSFDGDVIEAAGVFYNEMIVEGAVSGAYFTKERYDSGDAYLTYLRDVNLPTKWLDELTFETTEPVIYGTKAHEMLKEYEEPIFRALLDYAIGPGKAK